MSHIIREYAGQKNEIISECFTVNNHGFSFVSFSTDQTLPPLIGELSTFRSMPWYEFIWWKFTLPFVCELKLILSSSCIIFESLFSNFTGKCCRLLINGLSICLSLLFSLNPRRRMLIKYFQNIYKKLNVFTLWQFK